MSWLSRLTDVFRASRVNQDLDEELQFHLDARVDEPTIYLPQWPPGWAAVQVRARLEPAAVAALLREELPRVHPTFRITDLTLQSTLVDNVVVRERLLALLSGALSIVAIALVVIGLYGVLSYNVVQRTRAIGIRLALGARPVAVVRSVLANITLVTLLGAAAGIAGGLFFSRFVRALPFEIAPLDTLSLALPVACLLLVAVAAAFFPARRAARVDPVVALRDD